MIKINTEKISIEVDGIGSDYSLSACLDAVERLMSKYGKEGITSSEDEFEDPYPVMFAHSNVKPSEDDIARLSARTSMDRSMRGRMPNVVDLKELTLENPKMSEEFRCPSCHQSAFVIVSPATSDRSLVMRTEDGLYALKDVELEFETAEEYDKEMSDEKNVLKLMNHTSDKKEKVYLVKGSDSPCECPRCGDVQEMDVFVREFQDTSSEFEHPCIICGGEVILKNELQEDRTTKAIPTCESCGSTIQY